MLLKNNDYAARSPLHSSILYSFQRVALKGAGAGIMNNSGLGSHRSSQTFDTRSNSIKNQQSQKINTNNILSGSNEISRNGSQNEIDNKPQADYFL